MPKGVKGSGPFTQHGRTGSGRAVARTDGEFRPSAAHEKALAAVIADPALAGRNTSLADAIGVNEATIRHWKKNPHWRAWWNRALLEVSREMVGPCVQELQRLVFDPDVPASAKAKLVDTILKTVGPSKEGNMGTAVLAILERWNPHYGTTKIVATRDGIAAQIEGTRRGQDPAAIAAIAPAELAQRGQNASKQVPPEAMQLPQDQAEQLPASTLEQISRVAAEEATAMVRTVEVRAVNPIETEHRYTSAPRRPPSIALRAGDGGRKSQTVDQEPNEGRTSSGPGTPDPTNPESADTGQRRTLVAGGPPAGSQEGSPPPRESDPVRGVAPVPRLYPHRFRGGRCERCGFSEGTLSRWCKGPTIAGDSARGVDVHKRNQSAERDAGLARILRKMRERDTKSGDNA